MKKSLIIGFLVCLLVITACSNQKSSGIITTTQTETQNLKNFGENLNLRIGESAFLQNGNVKLEVKFAGIKEDSRCAAGVVCVWQGQVVPTLQTFKDDKLIGNLSITYREGSTAYGTDTFDQYTITIKDVQPKPEASQQIKLSDYLVTLVVDK